LGVHLHTLCFHGHSGHRRLRVAASFCEQACVTVFDKRSFGNEGKSSSTLKAVREGQARIKKRQSKLNMQAPRMILGSYANRVPRRSRRILAFFPLRCSLRDRYEISVSSYGAIRTDCIVPFSVERVGTFWRLARLRGGSVQWATSKS